MFVGKVRRAEVEVGDVSDLFVGGGWGVEVRGEERGEEAGEGLVVVGEVDGMEGGGGLDLVVGVEELEGGGGDGGVLID